MLSGNTSIEKKLSVIVATLQNFSNSSVKNNVIFYTASIKKLITVKIRK